MLAAAANDGITTVLATPHAHHVDAARVLAGVERLNTAAREAGIDIEVLPGHEARISVELVDRHRDGRLLTLNETRWLLLECYLHDDWPIHLIERSVDRLIKGGLRPILAHAERYPFVQREPEILRSLIARGVLIQVNAGSLFYSEADIERITAEHLLQTQMAHVIASDAHNARYRPPTLCAAYRRLAEIVGDEHADWMHSIPNRILNGSDIEVPV
jgi:protein-tyrosine phosphatase